ncbi:MAG: asparaginase [Thermoplasmata archaeon]|nr:asparaginase [Thermoplasmata archaeon]
MDVEGYREYLETEGDGHHVVIEERNGTVESIHRAHVAVVNPAGDLLYSSGDPEFYTYSRSCIKPFQMIPIMAGGAAELYGYTDEEIAMIAGSHSGEPEHLEHVRSIIRRSGITEDMLRCGPHPPFHRPSAKALKGEFEPIHNNCSAKHASVLGLCKMKGWPMDTYLEPTHPIQKEILKVFKNLTGDGDIALGSDGCAIPNYAMSIRTMAHLFAILGNSNEKPYADHISRIRESMLKNPYLVSGTERFDNLAMNALPGILITKGGASGVQAASLRTDRGWIGIALKVEDGLYTAVPPLLIHILKEMGYQVSGKIEELYRRTPIKNTRDDVVGSFVPMGKMKKNPTFIPK